MVSFLDCCIQITLVTLNAPFSAPWVFSEEKLYIIGVTPKSTAIMFLVTMTRKEAKIILSISGDFPGQLPGSALINNMYVWLQLLKNNFPKYLDDVQISRNGYVRHQLHY